MIKKIILYTSMIGLAIYVVAYLLKKKINLMTLIFNQ